MVTHTSITDLLQMTIRQFYRVYVAVGNVMEKKNNKG